MLGNLRTLNPATSVAKKAANLMLFLLVSVLRIFSICTKRTRVYSLGTVYGGGANLCP